MGKFKKTINKEVLWEFQLKHLNFWNLYVVVYYYYHYYYYCYCCCCYYYK